MLGFLTRSKKGFTMVELLIVTLLLGLGAFAVINVINVAYRSFDKSEERYIKQEAVKTVAELLRTGSNNVAAAQTADIFDDVSIVPTGTAKDESYSYLFFEPHEDEETGEVDGYYLYNLNKGKTRDSIAPLSDVPMYVEIRAYEAKSYEGATVYENQCGVIIKLAALEDDFDYASGELPTSDDIYYSLDVAYHFPNMVTNDTGITVNYVSKGTLSSANTYDAAGKKMAPVYAVECEEMCSPSHCGCQDTTHKCKDCDCDCDNKVGTVLRVYADSIISGDNTNTSVAVPKLCFIATASYGYDSGEVGLLCDFRDNVLFKSELGTAFVNAYYKLSPPIADFISEHEGLKAAVRVALKPVIVVAEYALEPELLEESAPWMIVFLGCLAGTVATVVVVKKRKNRIEE
jgi:prepilin-type N-terminal cleavage/methylation domain-containing protein